MSRPIEDSTERFWNKVKVTDPEGCWIWKAGRYPAGYGEFWLGDRNIGAHVYSYILHFGEVPDGMFVCHSCDHPWCVNPNHLFLGTPKDNTQDMIAKGRQIKIRILGNYKSGEKHHESRFTNEQVQEIRDFYVRGKRGHGLRLLAKRYSVHPNTIYSIVNNLSRRH